MQTIQQSLLLPYSNQQMFDLVNDVASYPRFLPWCSGATVTTTVEQTLQARVDIGFMGVNSFFTTLNTNTPPVQIDMTYLDGPFKQMSGQWQFKALAADACKVSFDLQYAFASQTLALIIGPVFNQITRRFIDAFGQEAQRRYGS